MKRLLVVSLSALLVALSVAVVRLDAKTQSNPGTDASAARAGKRAPIFRATKEQIKQAQTMLKERGFYNGETTGKLDADTRTGLRKYQEAEGLKVTGTLNRLTLEKMNIALTDKQKTISSS